MFVSHFCRSVIAFALISILPAACGEDRPGTVVPVADGSTTVTTGPATGALVVAGGNIKDARIIERFLELAGGPGVPIVVVPLRPDDDSEPFAVIRTESWQHADNND